jgi:hypothetical protein
MALWFALIKINSSLRLQMRSLSAMADYAGTTHPGQFFN